MSDYDYSSTFDFPPTSSVSTQWPISESTSAPAGSPSKIDTEQSSFSSFVCHTIYLERSLRGITPLVLDNAASIKKTGLVLGDGKTFHVEHAQWLKTPNATPVDVAVKEIIADDNTFSPYQTVFGVRTDWKDILLEIRALLHEPLKYHPNIIHILGLQWGISSITESMYPVLIMECSTLGSLRKLQASVDPLSFPVKQKLCFDIARGLSALHSCGIVHGDMKHENVLIFPNKNTDLKAIPYTAKLADFGGSIMDMDPDDSRYPEPGTWPFQAPGSKQKLSREGLKQADTYSFGLLVWRAFLDGEGFVSQPGASHESSDEEKASLQRNKNSAGFLRIAIEDWCDYVDIHKLPKSALDLGAYVLLQCLQLEPSARNLVKAHGALRGVPLGKIDQFLDLVNKENKERDDSEAREPPGKHGINRDGIAFYLGREHGEDQDIQDNTPGYRPVLDQPTRGAFDFQPEKLKSILSWPQQKRMVQELKEAAERTNIFSNLSVELTPATASFYLFQCFLEEFGVVFNAQEASEWLRKTVEFDGEDGSDYLAQSCLWRVSQAFGQPLDIPEEKLNSLLEISVIRGHKGCIEDLEELIRTSSPEASQRWLETLRQAKHVLLTCLGAVGMGYFFPKFLTKDFDLEDMGMLDNQIRFQLGDKFKECLKSESGALTTLVNRWRATKPPERAEPTPFDKIYINQRGHGILHLAAARGKLIMLQHLLAKYRLDINLPNQHCEESPLVCACQAGNLNCVSILLEYGANAKGHQFGQESPLHWLCSFTPGEMEAAASKLLRAGAVLEASSQWMRHDVRGIKSDWERMFEIVVTPLGRAVWMRSIDAVRVLLKHGANPHAKMGIAYDGKERKVISAIELAAILTLPDILMELLYSSEHPASSVPSVLSERDMLTQAHGDTITPCDSLSLQSRLLRCGTHYKEWMYRTLELLRGYNEPLRKERLESEPEKELQGECSVLIAEIARGNMDIVESLLKLGYSPDGTAKSRPLAAAILLNHEAIFNLLIQYGADVTLYQDLPEGGQESMIHMCAYRQRSSRPGRFIIDHLIKAGVPIQIPESKKPSPLAIAILKQNFDIATALLENGADMNATYETTSDNQPIQVTVLFDLLQKRSGHTLSSLQFLLNTTHSSHPIPSFIFNKTHQTTVLEVLATSQEYTATGQITPQIQALCIQTYSSPSQINHINPTTGSALYLSSLHGNLAMVSLLLDRDADPLTLSGPGPSIPRGPTTTILLPSDRKPIWAAILGFVREFQRLNAIRNWVKNKPNLEKIQAYEVIVKLLLARDEDVAAKQGWELAERVWKGTMEKYREGVEKRRGRRREWVEKEGGGVVDLAVLGRRGRVDEGLEGVRGVEWDLEGVLKGLEGLKV